MAEPNQTHDESDWERDAIAKYGHLIFQRSDEYLSRREFLDEWVVAARKGGE